MTNLEIQSQITQNLLLGLKKQSEAYLELISNTEYTHDQRKDFEKELSDINKVLNELSNKTVSYTVQELEQLNITFNEKLTELSTVITDLEVNTLKIEFNSLTPEQKEFLRGEKGEKGNNGLSSYELAKMYGFEGNEVDYLNSLKGAKGDIGLTGAKGEKGENGKDFTFDMFTAEHLQALKGENGNTLTYEDLSTEQKNDLVSYFNNSQTILDLSNSITQINNNIDSLNNTLNSLTSSYDSLNQRLTALENNQGSLTPPDSGNIDPNIIYENGSFIYQNEELLIEQKYYGLVYDYVVGDEIHLELTNTNNELTHLKFAVSQDSYYLNYYLDNLSTETNYHITENYNFIQSENDNTLVFGIEVNELPYTGQVPPIYIFKKYKITLIRNSEVYNLSNVIVYNEDEFYNLPQPDLNT